MHEPLTTLPIEQAAINLAAAAAISAVIGFERQWHNRLAGLRTNTLVALGAATLAAAHSRSNKRRTTSLISTPSAAHFILNTRCRSTGTETGNLLILDILRMASPFDVIRRGMVGASSGCGNE